MRTAARAASKRRLFQQSSRTKSTEIATQSLRTLATAERYSSSIATTDTKRLIDFGVSAKITGQESHIATVNLAPGETLRAESGAMLYMTDGVAMETNLQGASAAFTRMLTGQNMFLTDFTYTTGSGNASGGSGTGTGTVALGTDFPSKILRFTLQDMKNQNLICQRGAFLASNPGVNIEMEFTKSFSAGFFGGQGFVLQKLSGEGDVLIKGGGTVVKKDLQEGEVLRVSSGSIVAFESTVHYDVQMMPGIKNAMFGGEGLFVTSLQGPGQIWLQGMPADRMIAEIARRVPGPGIGLGIPIPMGGVGGGDASDAGEGAADETNGAGGGDEIPSGSEEMVAATDAAVNADRQATVAASGFSSTDSIDGDSPSALFGDAVSDDDGTAASADTSKMDDSSFASDSTEPTFVEDYSSQGDSTGFDDTDFQDEFSSDSGFNDGELFTDTTASDVMGSGGTEEGGSSLLGMLWDLVTGRDD